jgi:hypothetical protein
MTREVLRQIDLFPRIQIKAPHLFHRKPLAISPAPDVRVAAVAEVLAASASLLL